MTKYYKIADLMVEMDSFGRTIDQATQYEAEKTETIDIKIESYWPKLKEKYPTISDNEGEYLGTGKSFYKQLVDYDGLMLHASAVVVNNRAYLFSAPSGTGKSTHTSLWLKQFGEKAYILNDDKPALRKIDGEWFAYGTPWSGKHNLSVNKGIRVAGIALIERAEVNQIEVFSGKEAILAILKQVNHRTETADFRMKLLGLLDDLMTEVPIWKLRCNMSLEAAKVSYMKMSGEDIE